MILSPIDKKDWNPVKGHIRKSHRHHQEHNEVLRDAINRATDRLVQQITSGLEILPQTISKEEQEVKCNTVVDRLKDYMQRDNLPQIPESNLIPEVFDSYWDTEKILVFDSLCKDEGLVPSKLDQIIQDYMFSGKPPLRDAIISSLESKPSVLKRKGTGERVLDRMMRFVDTFINDVPSKPNLRTTRWTVEYGG